ncbi:MAG: CAP domain-containing protein [Bacteroidota bacterium]
MKTPTIFKSILVLLFSITLLSCSNEETIQEETNQPTIALKSYTHSGFEVELLDLVNQDRVSKGLSTLTIINEISYLASTHDDYMISKGGISHDNFEQRALSLKSGVGAIIVSENVASGFSSASSVMAAWNASPSHKANLEGDHTHYGLAVKADAAGKKYYTLLFIRK